MNLKLARSYNMKLEELFLTQEESKNVKDQKLLKAIRAQESPVVYNAGGTLQGAAWEDLVRLGLAERKRKSGTMSTSVIEWWEYSADAPGPITLRSYDGRDTVMNPGDTTDPIEVDYS